MQSNEGHKMCLNTEPHHIIEDHLLHFLGCIEFHERYEFLNSDEHLVWSKEREFLEQKLDADKAETQTTEQRQRWKLDCESELRRIDFLRSRLEEDGDEGHLVKCIRESRQYWKDSPEYAKGIRLVELNWKNRPRRDNIKKIDYESKYQQQNEYRLERDVNVPIIQFENGKPKNVVDEGVVWGTFPDQKINIGRLLEKGNHNHLYRHKEEQVLGHEGSKKDSDSPSNDSSQVKYFHIPSNNMAWAEKAVACYFNQEIPDFHAIRRETHRDDQTETCLILKDSHWRGQLHGDRTTVTVNSRFMRPFCDAISSDPTKVDHVPKNMVLFMPYMHWETSRNRERFAGKIEQLVLAAEKKKAADSKKAKINRQIERDKLQKIIFQQEFAESEVSLIQHLKKRIGAAPNGRVATENARAQDSDQGTGNVTRLEHPMTWGTHLRSRYGYPKTPFRMDSNRRVEIVRTENSVVNGNQEKKIGSPLGQYLIDAARLFEGMVNYRDKQLLQNFLMEDPPLHPRRTLDQAYYWTLKTTRSRDRDQVVYRATTADPARFHRFDQKKYRWKNHEHVEANTTCQDCSAKIKKVSRVIMVDQLWMWILDAKTIITCFPKRYGTNKNDASGVHKSIRARIAQGRHQQVKSVFDLALIILEECSNTFFDQSRSSDKQPQVLDAFSEAIGNIMHKQTVSFEKLWSCTKEAQKMYRHGARSYGVESKVYIPLLDITPEGKLENEIKDIIEEIGIMISIKKTNRDILKQFIGHVTHILDPSGNFGKQHARELTAKNVLANSLIPKKPEHPPDPAAQMVDQDQKDSYDWFKVNSDETLGRFNDRIEQLEELERSGVNVATSVKDLLELKQQQAGVLQAWLSLNQSDEAIKQSRSVMIFTIVTIVFLPLSFMSSIFGMNSIDFGGDGNTMHLREQFNYMFGISAGVIVLTLAFSLSDWLRAFVWSCYARGTLRFCTLTGLYRWQLKNKLSSHELYELTEEATTKLKDREKYLFKEEQWEKVVAAEKKTLEGPFPNGTANGSPNGHGHGLHATARRRWWRRKATDEASIA